MNQGGDILNFVLPPNQSSYIKVIGVGGGGSNAVNHMFRAGIKGVDFIVCNTDAQALESSPVPVKIHLGKGLGAGNVPQVARDAAIEKREEIKANIKDARMLFITAGMGGGTGTGAAPVVAEIAKEIELADDEVTSILTVAIVTTPFSFEGRKRQEQAKAGIEELRKHVDAILVINNDKLRDFGKMTLMEAFAMADNVLTTAAKGIAEIITVRSYVAIDFKDVNTVMHNSGVALMGFGTASGENRAKDAALMAMDSPLLNDNSIHGAKDMLLYLSYGPDEPLCMDEIETITTSILKEAGDGVDLIWGAGQDDALGASLNITLIATGFNEKRAFGIRKPEIVGTIAAKESVRQVSAPVNAAPAAVEKPVAQPQPMVQPVHAKEEPAPVSPNRKVVVLDWNNDAQDSFDEPQVQTELNFDAPAGPQAQAGTPSQKTVGVAPEEAKAVEPMQESTSANEATLWFNDLAARPVTENKIVFASDSNFGEPAMQQQTMQRSGTVSENLAEPVREVLVETASVQEAEVRESVSDGLLKGRCEATVERMKRLREFSGMIRSPQGLRRIEEEPACVRQNISIEPILPSSVSEAGRHSIGKDGSVNYEPPFLADQAD